MRLATRMKITYGMVFFIPILLMVIMELRLKMSTLDRRIQQINMRKTN